MVELTWWSGCGIGVATHALHNGIMRVPLARYPYMYVLLGVAGGYFCQFVDNKVEEQKVRVQELQRQKMEQNLKF
jgi:hypothetical protein